MSDKIKSIVIYENINDLIKLNLEKSNEVIEFHLYNNLKEFLKLNDKYQKYNKKLIYFIYHKNYNSIKNYIRNSDIFIYYTTQDDIDLYIYLLNNIDLK